jgi:hypothetical protein
VFGMLLTSRMIEGLGHFGETRMHRTVFSVEKRLSSYLRYLCLMLTIRWVLVQTYIHIYIYIYIYILFWVRTSIDVSDALLGL